MKQALLLGAGFSYDLGMPLASELTEVFLDLFTEENVKSLEISMSSQQPFTKMRPINRSAIASGLALLLDYKHSRGTNYEAFLSELQSLKGIASPTQSDRDSYEYLFGCFYEVIHTILCFYQQASYDILYDKNRQWFSKLTTFLSDVETWVFTLNHDLYLEYLALDLGVAITYGDNAELVFPINNLDLTKRIAFSYAERKNVTIERGGFFKGVRGFNLVKLHGGLSELEYKDKTLLLNLKLDKPSSRELAQTFELSQQMAYYHNGKPIPGGRDRTITNLDGELDIISKSMLTGGRKYSHTSKVKEGEEKLQLMDNALRDVEELTIIGYGFGDEHINFRLSNALLLNEKLRIVIVDPQSRETPSCIKQFDYDLRVRRATCGAAHWMDYRKSNTWNTEQTNALKENQRYRDDIRTRVEESLRKSI